MKKIILASSSPRRKELLELAGIPFSIHPSDITEKVDEDHEPFQIVEQLALQKAKDVAKYYNEEIVIGADTIVVFQGEILGKPVNEEDAFHTLKKLQGNPHLVYSGIALIDSKTGRSQTVHQVTKVFMFDLTDEEILSYIQTKEPMDKAGAYGIQGIGSIFIEKIEGDYFNVVGLPLSLLSRFLKSFDVDVMTDFVNPKSKV